MIGNELFNRPYPPESQKMVLAGMEIARRHLASQTLSMQGSVYSLPIRNAYFARNAFRTVMTGMSFRCLLPNLMSMGRFVDFPWVELSVG